MSDISCQFVIFSNLIVYVCFSAFFSPFPDLARPLHYIFADLRGAKKMDKLKQTLLDMAIRQITAHEQELVDFVLDVATDLFFGTVAPVDVEETPPPPPPVVTPPKPPKQEPENKPYNFGGIIPLEVWER
jgi:hypothetical protein